MPTATTQPPQGPPRHADEVVFNFTDAISFLWVFGVGFLMWWIRKQYDKRDAEQEKKDVEYAEFKKLYYADREAQHILNAKQEGAEIMADKVAKAIEAGLSKRRGSD